MIYRNVFTGIRNIDTKILIQIFYVFSQISFKFTRYTEPHNYSLGYYTEIPCREEILRMYKQKKILARILVLSGILFFLSGCWKQHDVITISSNGDVTFESEAVITEKDFSFSDIEGLSNEFMQELVNAGWEMKKKWLSKKKPFKLLFSGEGNLRKVGNASDFYKLKRIDEKKLQIQFIPFESKGKKSSRSIVFQTSMLRNDAIVLAPDGKSISQIKNVLGNEWYTIILKKAELHEKKETEIKKTPSSVTVKTKNTKPPIDHQTAISNQKALVTNIQQKLKLQGYYKTKVDGLYGRGTAAAIEAYQLDNDLQIDGKPTKELLTHLESKKETAKELTKNAETEETKAPQTLEDKINNAVEGIFKSIFKK